MTKMKELKGKENHLKGFLMRKINTYKNRRYRRNNLCLRKKKIN